jgi:hypothetical protein
VAGKLNHKGILVLKERVVADGTGLGGVEGCLRDTFEHCLYHAINQQISNAAFKTPDNFKKNYLLSQNSSLTPSTSRGGVSASVSRVWIICDKRSSLLAPSVLVPDSESIADAWRRITSKASASE